MNTVKKIQEKLKVFTDSSIISTVAYLSAAARLHEIALNIIDMLETDSLDEEILEEFDLETELILKNLGIKES